MPGAQGRGGAQMGPGGRSPRAAPREQHGRGGLMLKIEVDGRPLEVPQGATVMDATNQLGVYVPHFCYHRKLSIDRKSTRLNSSHLVISYAVFCLKKKKLRQRSKTECR